jgi:hypothetical protein
MLVLAWYGMKLGAPRMACSKYQMIRGANTPYTRAKSALDAILIPDWYESLRKAPNTFYHSGEFWQLAIQK